MLSWYVLLGSSVALGITPSARLARCRGYDASCSCAGCWYYNMSGAQKNNKPCPGFDPFYVPWMWSGTLCPTGATPLECSGSAHDWHGAWEAPLVVNW